MADLTTLRLPQITRHPLHEEAADRLRELIVQGRLGPGTRLNERLLCVQFGVSRTPLRDASRGAEGDASKIVHLVTGEGAEEAVEASGTPADPEDPPRPPTNGGSRPSLKRIK